MNRTMLAFIVACSAVAGCAKTPESIAPAYVSPLNYQALDCDQIAEETARVETALVQVYAQQRDARTNDIVGVIFLGLPVSSLSGDNVASQVARLKGEQETLRKTATHKRCSLPPPPDN